MVRAGAVGEREKASITEGLSIAGWPELGDLSECRTWDAMRTAIAGAYPRENPRVIGNWCGQL
jgi:restriction system protein